MDAGTVAVIVAFVTAVGGSVAGLAALRRSGSEAAKANAEAAGSIVGASQDVVTLLREQMADMAAREDHRDRRLMALEVTVGAWEGWAERVLGLLDRAMEMLAVEQREKLRHDVDAVRREKPPRGTGGRSSNG